MRRKDKSCLRACVFLGIHIPEVNGPAKRSVRLRGDRAGSKLSREIFTTGKIRTGIRLAVRRHSIQPLRVPLFANQKMAIPIERKAEGSAPH